MRAKDYFDKYKNGLVSEDRDTYVLTVQEMYQEMFKECVDTIRVRRITRIASTHAVVSVFKEMNEEYNALCRLLAKEYMGSPIKENGFVYLACGACERLKPYFTKELKGFNRESEDTE